MGTGDGDGDMGWVDVLAAEAIATSIEELPFAMSLSTKPVPRTNVRPSPSPITTSTYQSPWY